ncbi:MAG: DUF4337 family protein [Tepidisphaeraceae bacterium]|jgi:hypothetical protein
MAKTSQFASLANDPERKRTTWETVLVSTPIILTVVATVLAGLSSSEMSSAQYFRSLAAQMQSKASDQWGYFQAKRLRAEQCANTLQVLQNLAQPAPFDARDLRQAGNRLIARMKRAMASDSKELTEHLNRVEACVARLSEATTRPDEEDQIAGFGRGDVPIIKERAIEDRQIIDAMRAVDSHVSETELERQAGMVDQATLDGAFAVANDNAAAFDQAVSRTGQANAPIEATFAAISRETAAFEAAARRVAANEVDNAIAAVHESAAQLNAAFGIAQLRFNSNRENREAHYNQVLAQLYEIQVRRESFTSERHRLRSRQFFYGMLGAQAGVTIATFSLAVRRGSWLWGLAASAGLAAVTFAAYVYLFV